MLLRLYDTRFTIIIRREPELCCVAFVNKLVVNAKEHKDNKLVGLNITVLLIVSGVSHTLAKINQPFATVYSFTLATGLYSLDWVANFYRTFLYNLLLKVTTSQQYLGEWLNDCVSFRNPCSILYYAHNEFVVKTERCNCTNVYVGTCDIMLVVSLFCGIYCDRFYVVESNINSKTHKVELFIVYWQLILMSVTLSLLR